MIWIKVGGIHLPLVDKYYRNGYTLSGHKYLKILCFLLEKSFGLELSNEMHPSS